VKKRKKDVDARIKSAHDELAARVCVAQIGAPHGLHGEVKLKSFTADPMAISDYAPLESEDGTARFEIEELRQSTGRSGGYLIARLRGIADRNAASRLKHLRLFVARERLPTPEPDEFYHADLIGLRALRRDGSELGKVTAVHDFGAGAILEIAGDGGELMLPFTDMFVPNVDLREGVIVVVPPEPAGEGI
jgi:16S rRNA processing protein RimM